MKTALEILNEIRERVKLHVLAPACNVSVTSKRRAGDCGPTLSFITNSFQDVDRLEEALREAIGWIDAISGDGYDGHKHTLGIITSILNGVPIVEANLDVFYCDKCNLEMTNDMPYGLIGDVVVCVECAEDG